MCFRGILRAALLLAYLATHPALFAQTLHPISEKQPAIVGANSTQLLSEATIAELAVRDEWLTLLHYDYRPSGAAGQSYINSDDFFFRKMALMIPQPN